VVGNEQAQIAALVIYTGGQTKIFAISIQACAQAMGQFSHKILPGVVAGAVIFTARIAEADN
jgi:hypothetical protein